MKKFVFLFALVFSTLASAQYNALFSFKTDQPNEVVSSLQLMMESDYGKSIKASVTLYAVLFAGEDTTTHAVAFDFADEKSLNDFFNSWATNSMAKILDFKFSSLTENTSTRLNIPLWYKGDWRKDNTIMIWQLDVKNPPAFVKDFSEFSVGYEEEVGATGSYGIGQPLIGQNGSFSHFVWAGAKDMPETLIHTKKLYASSAFAKMQKKTSAYSELKSTLMLQKIMQFN